MLNFLLVLSALLVVGLVCFCAYWLYVSFANFIDAKEMGIRVMFGEADVDVYEGGAGWIFVPWLPSTFKCYIKKYSMAMFDLDYDPIKVMSKEGDYPATGGQHYGTVEESVESMAYLNFPRKREMLVNKETDEPVCFLKDLNDQERKDLDAHGKVVRPDVTLVLEKTHPLIKIFRAGVPTPNVFDGQSIEDRAKEVAKLEDWSEEGMTSSVRAAAAQIIWKEANENPSAFRDKVEESYLKVDGALIKAGFRPSGIKLAIKRVDPPENVKDSLSGEEAAPHVAKRESVEVGDALTQMVDKQIESMKKSLPAGEVMTKGDCMRIRQECLNQLTRDRTMKGGGKLADVRVASADGTSFAQGSLSEVIGGVVATAVAAWASKDQGGGKPNRGGIGKKPKDMTDDEARESAADA